MRCSSHYSRRTVKGAHEVMISNDDSTSSSSTGDLFEPNPSKRCRVLDSEERSSSSSSDTIIPSWTTTDDSDNDEEKVLDTNWHTPLCCQPKIKFSSPSGINTRHSEIFELSEPHSFYCLFVSNEIFEIIANQTNKYAAKIVSEQRSSRFDKWIETNPNEIKRFFGLIIWMGLVRLPKIHLYWSINEEYHQTFPSSVMSRNRFELLLRFIYFSDNEGNDPGNILSKISPITDLLNRTFKKYYNPNEILCVDEWLVPFQGHISRQYFKRHRYGIKVVKLCCGPGYTYSVQMYSEKEISRDKTAGTVSSDIIMSLCSDVLGKGHTICTDIRYTSVDLAEKLIANNTHLMGALRENQRGNSLELVSTKLKRGEVIARENKSGITILKWKDKRNVLMLSTKHSAEMTTVHKKYYLCEKPKMFIEYNLGKSSVDLSDQMIVYNSPLRTTIKWYRKLAIELLLNTCMVNSMILFKKITTTDIQISDFRMKVAMYLTKCHDEEPEVCILPSEGLPGKPRHESREMSGRSRHELRTMPGKQRHKSKAMSGNPRHESRAKPAKQRHESTVTPGKPRHESTKPGKPRYESTAMPGKPRYESTAMPEKKRYESTAIPENPLYESTAMPEKKRYESTAVPEKKRYESTVMPENPLYKSTEIPGNPRYESTAMPEKKRYESTAIPGNPRYESTAIPGNPRYESTAVPEKKRYESTAIPENPLYESTEIPGNPRHESTAMPEKKRYESTAMPENPLYEPTAIPGDPLYESTAIPGDPLYESIAIPGDPLYESTAIPGDPLYESIAIPGDSLYESTAIPGDPLYESTAIPGDPRHESTTVPEKLRHELKAMPGKVRTVRRFCKNCYQKNSEKLGRVSARNCSKKVVTYCNDCAGTPFLCLECFDSTHRNVGA